MIDREKFLHALVSSLELPDSAYFKAKKRYKDIGDWFEREESAFSKNNPHIFPQGSFRLGTAIYPLNRDETYDLDLACEMRDGVNPETHSQEDLKVSVGRELEQYRIFRKIESPLEEKHRCWRLNYKDSPGFHMDIVPCIPQTRTVRQAVLNRMNEHQTDSQLAEILAKFAVGITDDKNEGYPYKNREWPVSNPEGYARWFEARMRQGKGKSFMLNMAQVDDIPEQPEKTQLQRTVQILKRHRDQKFRNNSKSAPISIIITTLAGQSYRGSSSLAEALEEVLEGLKAFADSNSDEVLNPVNPAENFADKWNNPEYAHLRLKENFRQWVMQVCDDFRTLRDVSDIRIVSKLVKNCFDEDFSEERLHREFGYNPHQQKPVVFETPKKSTPWYGR